MKIALCFIGMIRTGVQASENIKYYFRSYYNHIDCFMHTWDRSEPKLWHKDSIHAKNNAVSQSVTPIDSALIIDQLKRKYNDKFISIEIENQSKFFDTPLWKEYTNFSPQWYSWYKGISLVRDHEEKQNFKYDLIVKIRPDIIRPVDLDFSEEMIHATTDKNKLYTLGYDPRRIDDVMFLGSSDVMYRASKFFIETNKKSWETNILGEWFHQNNILVADTVNTRYTIYRQEDIDRRLSPMQFDACRAVDLEYYSPE